MLKIVYKEPSSPIINQLYDVDVEIKIEEDACLEDVYKAMCKIANIATYHCTLKTLKNFIELLEAEGYEDNDRIM